MKSLFGVAVFFAMVLSISPINTNCAFAVPISLDVTGKVANLEHTLGIGISDNDDFSGKFIFDYNDELTIIENIAMQLYVNEYSIISPYMFYHTGADNPYFMYIGPSSSLFDGDGNRIATFGGFGTNVMLTSADTSLFDTPNILEWNTDALSGTIYLDDAISWLNFDLVINDIDVQPAPEPGTLFLMVFGLALCIKKYAGNPKGQIRGSLAI